MDGVDGCGAASGNHARNASGDNQNDNSDRHHAEVNTRDLVELCLHIADAEHSGGNTNHETEERLRHGAAHHHADDACAFCAESHADADFRGATDDDVRRHAVESDRGEQKCQAAEERSQPRDHPLVIEPVSNLLVEGLELDDRQVWIDPGKRALRKLLHVVHQAIGVDDDRAGIERNIGVDRRFLAGRTLRDGHEEHGVILPLNRRIRGVVEHTDYLEISRDWLSFWFIAVRSRMKGVTASNGVRNCNYAPVDDAQAGVRRDKPACCRG